MNEFLLLKNKSAKLILLLGLDLYDRMSGSAQYWCKAVELKYQIYSNKPIGFGFVRLSVQKYPMLVCTHVRIHKSLSYPHGHTSDLDLYDCTFRSTQYWLCTASENTGESKLSTLLWEGKSYRMHVRISMKPEGNPGYTGQQVFLSKESRKNTCYQTVEKVGTAKIASCHSQSIHKK